MDSEKDAIRDLGRRVVGKRYLNTEINEAFSVIGVMPPLVLIQYDDGTAYDEAMSPDLLTPAVAEFAQLSEGGIDDAKYEPLPGGGPVIHFACDDGGHQFWPLPSHIGLDDTDIWHDSRNDHPVSDSYLRLVRCRRCGLSGDVLMEFLGHDTPGVCERCECDIVPGENAGKYSPNPDWEYQWLCSECTDTVNADYEPYEVSCVSCGVSLGTNEENQYIWSQSMVAQALGVTDPEDEFVFACESCLTDSYRKLKE